MAENDFDVAVIGAGAGGLTAAIFSALEGARTILIEREEYIGGTSALSAGTAWIPGTATGKAACSDDTIGDARRYLDNVVGNKSSSAIRETFLQNGAKAVAMLTEKAGLEFRARPHHPDYLAEIDGATTAGRAIEPPPFDASPLGDSLALIRPPIPEFTILGGLMVDRDDIHALLNMTKSPAALWHAMKLLGGYAKDRLLHGRTRRLVMGNALIGRLLLAANKQGVKIITSASVSDIEKHEKGFILRLEGREPVRAGKAIIIATGGFARHPRLRGDLLPGIPAGNSPAAPGHTGALHDIIRSLGGVYAKGNGTHAFMAPVSICRRGDGSRAVFPHFVLDRSKPGIIAVGKDGLRFTNEARSYHEFALAQMDTDTVPAFLVADADAVRKYGLGMVRPGGGNAKSLIRRGYLKSGGSLDALAGKIGVDAAGLRDTAGRMNDFAATGVDADFGRGGTIYETTNGDAAHAPNPALGRIATPPFYAVELYPADIGACTGFASNEKAEVLDKHGKPLGGIYACGNDMQSIMGDVYPGPGITIGPAITFAFIAARHATATATADQRNVS